jgi:NDP-sugar pyrophosphorylase family protein
MKGKQIVSQSRPLSAQEVSQLVAQGCTCADWSQVQVAQDFRPQCLQSAHFSGRMTLGAFGKRVSSWGGFDRPAGIYNATLHNCTVGDNARISQVHGCIANYVIEDEAVIEDVGLLAVEGESTFGNGLDVAVVNEAGGREVTLCDRLSAHTAYIMAFYRHRPVLIEKLRAMIGRYAASVRSPMGRIGKGARIAHSRILRNVKVGPAAVIEGADHLENGSINSRPDDPVYVGSGVCAEDFIVGSGARITDGAIIRRCFVGQHAEVASQFCATQSLIFANCSLLNGEACAVFAGPHTVSHHKSTLLIAGLFSFFNAGSGTNQSNHMYRLGPVHQGICERGCKTASNAYLRWPARIGAFTTIAGRHSHADLSDLPFSYLLQVGNEILLQPGRSLGTVGTARDAEKWRRRDERPQDGRLDQIHTHPLSPYTVSKISAGQQFLSSLPEDCEPGSDRIIYRGVKTPKTLVRQGIALYRSGIDRFLGECLARQLEGQTFRSVDELRTVLRPQSRAGAGPWIDLAGLLAPESSVEEVVDGTENGQIADVDDLNARWRALHEAYAQHEWAWAVDFIERQSGKTIDSITAGDVVDLVKRWRDAAGDLDRQVSEDARKEFAWIAQVGYGVDGDEKTRQADFEAVRKSLEDENFTAKVEQRAAATDRLTADLLNRLQPLTELP